MNNLTTAALKCKPIIDPLRFTDYHRSMPSLQAALIFSVLVAGKNALTMARALDRLLTLAYKKQEKMFKLFASIYPWFRPPKHPFVLLRAFSSAELAEMMRECGIGCYNQKAMTVDAVVRAGLNLRKCNVQDLEAIKGIGPKTARLFLVHTRENYQAAVLDVHILRCLQDRGYVAPKTTPSSPVVYARLESICLGLAEAAGLSPADWDLSIWNLYRGRKQSSTWVSGGRRASQGAS